MMICHLSLTLQITWVFTGRPEDHHHQGSSKGGSTEVEPSLKAGDSPELVLPKAPEGLRGTSSDNAFGDVVPNRNNRGAGKPAAATGAMIEPGKGGGLRTSHEDPGAPSAGKNARSSRKAKPNAADQSNPNDGGRQG